MFELIIHVFFRTGKHPVLFLLEVLRYLRENTYIAKRQLVKRMLRMPAKGVLHES